MNTPVTASVVWTDPRGMIIPEGNVRRWVEPSSGRNFVSSLLFLPIDIGHFNDNGTYTCAMNLNSADTLITISQPNSTIINVTVERKLQCNTDFNLRLALSLSLSIHTYSIHQVSLI